MIILNDHHHFVVEKLDKLKSVIAKIKEVQEARQGDMAKIKGNIKRSNYNV